MGGSLVVWVVAGSIGKCVIRFLRLIFRIVAHFDPHIIVCPNTRSLMSHRTIAIVGVIFHMKHFQQSTWHVHKTCFCPGGRHIFQKNTRIFVIVVMFSHWWHVFYTSTPRLGVPCRHLRFGTPFLRRLQMMQNRSMAQGQGPTFEGDGGIDLRWWPIRDCEAMFFGRSSHSRRLHTGRHHWTSLNSHTGIINHPNLSAIFHCKS